MKRDDRINLATGTEIKAAVRRASNYDGIPSMSAWCIAELVKVLRARGFMTNQEEVKDAS